HYRGLHCHEETGVMDALLVTTCGRFDRVASLLRRHPPSGPDECFDVLQDPQVQVGITVQQMVFHPRSGEAQVRIPEPPP
ncbi:MAG TPA: hypothetical protein VFU47_17595, partial [Armatimonadota bacterium]|nr:hypothetical protein [Armatimonadota bacterium]